MSVLSQRSGWILLWWDICFYFLGHLVVALFFSRDRKRPKPYDFISAAALWGCSNSPFQMPLCFQPLSSSRFAVRRLSDTVLKDIDFLFSLVVIQGHFLNADYSSSVWSHGRWALSLVHWAFELLRTSEGLHIRACLKQLSPLGLVWCFILLFCLFHSYGSCRVFPLPLCNPAIGCLVHVSCSHLLILSCDS